MFCNRCGAPATGNFCSSCGAPLTMKPPAQEWLQEYHYLNLIQNPEIRDKRGSRSMGLGLVTAHEIKTISCADRRLFYWH